MTSSWNVIAFEEDTSRVFLKTVQLISRAGRRILSFGGPCEYDFESLKQLYEERGPKNLCIDIGGGNHGVQNSVLVRAEDMLRILKGVC